MKGVFISHSTENRELTKQVIELLQLGMGIGRDRIFCTSLNGDLCTGEDFITTIKTKMQECEMVLALITPEYLQSKFCMMELGAAWVQESYLCPFLGSGVTYKDLEDTPLKSFQIRKLEDKKDLYAVYDEMATKQFMMKLDSMQFQGKVDEFLQKVSIHTGAKDHFIYPDSDGYYQVKIDEIRKVPPQYRCYKIAGNLALQERQQDPVQEESQWIFFQAGMFDDLKPGDFVQLKVERTEQKMFKDIGRVRNIYLKELCILENADVRGSKIR